MSDVELVIKIPREQYALIMQSHRDGAARFVEKEAMMYAIKNGTPLSEVLEEIKGEINQLDIHPEHVFVGGIDTWWNGALERCVEIIDNHIKKEQET